MSVFVLIISGGEYEDKWREEMGVFSTKEKALSEFERLKEKNKDKDEPFDKWNEPFEEWHTTEICEYELDGEFKSQELWVNEDGKWEIYRKKGKRI